MKNKIIVLATSLLALAFAGCGTMTPRSAGSDLGLVAAVVFDSPEDEKKFRKIRKEIQAYVKSGKPITKAIIDRYIEDKVLSRFSGNPRAIKALAARIQGALDSSEFNLPEGPEISGNLEEFVGGLLESLELMYPDIEE